MCSGLRALAARLMSSSLSRPMRSCSGTSSEGPGSRWFETPIRNQPGNHAPCHLSATTTPPSRIGERQRVDIGTRHQTCISSYHTVPTSIDTIFTVLPVPANQASIHIRRMPHSKPRERIAEFAGGRGPGGAGSRGFSHSYGHLMRPLGPPSTPL